MWQETKQGLYKEFVFVDFEAAWQFMSKVSEILKSSRHFVRWQNEANMVMFWLTTNDNGRKYVSGDDWELAALIDKLSNEKKQMKDDKNVAYDTTVISEIKLYADGGSRGNPGPSASGFVVLDLEDKVLYSQGTYLGVTTNNQAEYQALKLGLEYAAKANASKVNVFMDSLLVINQMKGVFKVKNRDLWPVHESIKKQAAKFKSITYTHVPRELNKLADAEVNKCLDSEVNSEPQEIR